MRAMSKRILFQLISLGHSVKSASRSRNYCIRYLLFVHTDIYMDSLHVRCVLYLQHVQEYHQVLHWPSAVAAFLTYKYRCVIHHKKEYKTKLMLL